MRYLGFIGWPWRAQSQTTSRLGRGIEALLLIILAVQIARLIWAFIAATGPFGDWQARTPSIPSPAARIALFSAFDPFYRDAGPGSGDIQQVTSLPLQLFGIRYNEGSGLGSAIIADQTGLQSSYSVGEEVSPGVVLTGVSHDHVTLSRGGVSETLYLDQSASSGLVDQPDEGDAGAGAASNPAPTISEPLSPATLLNGVAFAPRTENGSVTGIVVGPQGGGDVFARAGFRPGDIVAQVNGSPIRSAQDLADLRDAIRPGARLTLMVERGSATVPIALIIPDTK